MADKHIQMQRKRADGGFDKYYPKTKVELVEGAASEAQLDAHMADYVRQAGYAVTGGTSTAYTATLDPAPASIVEGFSITIVPHVDCGNSPTLNVNGKGAIQLRNRDGEPFAAGDIVAGRPYNFCRVGSYFFVTSGGGEVEVTHNALGARWTMSYMPGSSFNLSAMSHNALTRFAVRYPSPRIRLDMRGIANSNFYRIENNVIWGVHVENTLDTVIYATTAQIQRHKLTADDSTTEWSITRTELEPSTSYTFRYAFSHPKSPYLYATLGSGVDQTVHICQINKATGAASVLHTLTMSDYLNSCALAESNATGNIVVTDKATFARVLSSEGDVLWEVAGAWSFVFFNEDNGNLHLVDRNAKILAIYGPNGAPLLNKSITITTARAFGVMPLTGNTLFAEGSSGVSAYSPDGNKVWSLLPASVQSLGSPLTSVTVTETLPERGPQCLGNEATIIYNGGTYPYILCVEEILGEPIYKIKG